MSNFAQEFEDDEQFQSTILAHSSNVSPNPTEIVVDGSYPDAEVVALSPRTLMATNRYICEVCHKGFQRDQNLQLHRRGHNLPWKLKQRASTQVKKRVYICPEPKCVHHDPTRALGDLTGIKKHFCRKHGEKKWKCDKCSKRYAVQSDWKAHAKICGTREKDSFVTHRAFCDALAEENYKANQNLATARGMLQSQAEELFTSSIPSLDSCSKKSSVMNMTISDENVDTSLGPLSLNSSGIMMSSNFPILNTRTSNVSPMAIGSASVYASATALLQKAAEMGTKISDNSIAPILLRGFAGYTSSGSAQEGSLVIGSNIGPTTGNMNSLSMGETQTSDKNLDPGYPRNVYAISQTGLLESTLNMPPENGNAADNLGEFYMGTSQKMTLDFLGVEPSTGKKRSYQGNIVGLGYSNIHQNFNNLHSEW
ncbi:hypothetical protein JCGZ_23074 [Jatropha curcas]|uniref:C2H2-type domain-containing protein n=1 Tax=Jatropha curcas TaxID=180498 RepID=A0A067JH63_JATCU|nr:hypothetical protein JCGZ_23074 [Jatropha curcas]